MPKQILIVDDNPDDAELLVLFLRRRGIVNPIQVVPDGLNAIDYLYGLEPYANRQAFPFPALIFLDINMPRNSGYDVLQWLEAHPEIPAPEVVISTTAIEPKELEKCYRLGATSFLSKLTKDEQFRDLLIRYPDIWEFADFRPADL